MACDLTAAECFREHVASLDYGPSLKQGSDGWWSMRCGVGRHGKPIRLRVGDHAHLYYTDLGGCDDAEVHAWLVRQGMPAGCLRKPKTSKPVPAEAGPRTFGPVDGKLADEVLAIAFGPGTATERLVRISMLAADDELAAGPLVGAFAANLRVSPATIYRATADERRKGRGW